MAQNDEFTSKSIPTYEAEVKPGAPQYMTLNIVPRFRVGAGTQGRGTDVTYKVSMKNISENVPNEPYIEFQSRQDMWSVETGERFAVLTIRDGVLQNIHMSANQNPNLETTQTEIDVGAILENNMSRLPTLELVE